MRAEVGGWAEKKGAEWAAARVEEDKSRTSSCRRKKRTGKKILGKATIFVGNSGADIVWRILPLAREFFQFRWVLTGALLCHSSTVLLSKGVKVAFFYFSSFMHHGISSCLLFAWLTALKGQSWRKKSPPYASSVCLQKESRPFGCCFCMFIAFFFSKNERLR